MSRIVTLREHKALEADRRRRAVLTLREGLGAYTHAHGGRFLLFGSAARGEMRHNSDVDILVDFPPDALDAAWVYAEDTCRSLRLTPDIRPLAWCSPAFLAHVTQAAQVIA